MFDDSDINLYYALKANKMDCNDIFASYLIPHDWNTSCWMCVLNNNLK